MSSRTKRSMPQAVEHAYAYKHHKLARLTDSFTTLALAAIRWGSLVGIAYIGYLSVVEMAGRETFATIIFDLAASMKADRWIAYIVGGGGILYGLNERRIRQRSTKRLTDRPKQLEKLLHQQRTSSGLTPTGGTRKSDE